MGHPSRLYLPDETAGRDPAWQRRSCGCVKRATSLSGRLYRFCASCYRHFPYRHSARQAAGPLIENLPYVLTGDREPVDLYSLTTTAPRSSRSATTQRPTGNPATAPSSQAPSLRKTRLGLCSRGVRLAGPVILGHLAGSSHAVAQAFACGLVLAETKRRRKPMPLRD
jgi:hypothetical protein